MKPVKFCASCTEYLVSGAPVFDLDGATICSACNGNDARLDSKTPEVHQLGYQCGPNTDVTGVRFSKAVTSAYRRIVHKGKRRVSQDNHQQLVSGKDWALTVNEELVRFSITHKGFTLDRHEALTLLQADLPGQYRHLATTGTGWHMFARLRIK